MPHITFTVEPDGVIIRVVVGVTGARTAALLAAGQVPPRPVLLRGVIDTGTDVTAVASAALQQLGLVRVRRLSSHTAGGTIIANIFELSLTVPPWGHLTAALLVFDHLEVMELVQAPPNIDVLVGRDVLAQALMVYDGRRGECTLAD
jgi:hypothetical protein